MTCRLPILTLPAFALLVALTLLSHDGVMATGPHDPASHATHHDTHTQYTAEPAPHGDESTACGELEAARTRELTRDPDSVAATASPIDALSIAGGDAPLTGLAEPGTPPGQFRAMLQVWLN